MWSLHHRLVCSVWDSETRAQASGVLASALSLSYTSKSQMPLHCSPSLTWNTLGQIPFLAKTKRVLCWAGETAPSVMCLPYKHEHLSSICRTHVKTNKQKTGANPETSWSARLVYLGNSSLKTNKQRIAPEKQQPTAMLCLYLHQHLCSYTVTQTCTCMCIQKHVRVYFS